MMNQPRFAIFSVAYLTDNNGYRNTIWNWHLE